MTGTLTDVPGIKVGHFTDSRRPTGCTVVLTEEGAVAGVDVRGSAPGTRETDLLNPINAVEEIHAVVLSGGSAFGLDTACGVVRFLEEKGIGYPTRIVPIPIVPAAILFDLALGDPAIRPDCQAGYQACLNANSGPVEEGSVGCGAGATVGKLLGPERAMKGGLGSAAVRAGDLVVGALVAVNSLGNVIDPETGKIVAGARTPDGRRLAPREAVFDAPYRPFGQLPGENTTLAVVATNARLNKPAMTKIAQMSHDGFARAINPVHLPFDGDVVFALSTGRIEGAGLSQVGMLAAEATALAIVRAVTRATSVPGYPACRDLLP
ncbi:MAG: peptidase S58 family protein [Acidobacteria bacterium]|nr:MAG: peptidase S58 family protein [Acidobacteriota bacterium]